MSISDWEKIEAQKQNIINGDTIADIWSLEDVYLRADETNFECNHESAQKILAACKVNFDANVGINWDVLDAEIDNYCLKGRVFI